MYCIFHEVPRETFMIHPEGFKTILDCLSLQDNPNIWNVLYKRRLDMMQGLREQCRTLPHSLFLSIRQLCHMQSNSSVNQEIYALTSSKSGGLTP